MQSQAHAKTRRAEFQRHRNSLATAASSARPAVRAADNRRPPVRRTSRAPRAISCSAAAIAAPPPIERRELGLELASCAKSAKRAPPRHCICAPPRATHKAAPQPAPICPVRHRAAPAGRRVRAGLLAPEPARRRAPLPRHAPPPSRARRAAAATNAGARSPARISAPPSPDRRTPPPPEISCANFPPFIRSARVAASSVSSPGSGASSASSLGGVAEIIPFLRRLVARLLQPREPFGRAISTAETPTLVFRRERRHGRRRRRAAYGACPHRTARGRPLGRALPPARRRTNGPIARPPADR